MRFLHLADVHLDTPFQGRSPELRDRLGEACRNAFRRAVTLALEEEVHAILIAGDLFDGERLTFATESFLMAETGRLAEAGVPVIYAPGNHDPSGGAGPGSIGRMAWPENVRILGSAEPERVPVRGREGTVVGHVTGAGHEGPRETRDLSRAFPEPPGPLPEVALLHAQVVGARSGERHDPYAPAELRTLRASGYHYWALGHVHARQVLEEDPPIHYPGNLQGRNPRETGPKGGLLVDLTDPRSPEVTFRALAPIRWEELAVESLEDAGSLAALRRTVESAWEEVRDRDPGEPGTEWIVRVLLSGPCPLHAELARDDALEELARDLTAHLDVLDVEVRTRNVHRPVRVEEHRDRRDVLGEALELLEEARRHPEVREEIRPRVLAGVQEGDVEDAGAYVLELLEGLEGELVARVVNPEGEG